MQIKGKDRQLAVSRLPQQLSQIGTKRKERLTADALRAIRVPYKWPSMMEANLNGYLRSCAKIWAS